jgi:hypothetical protein
MLQESTRGEPDPGILSVFEAIRQSLSKPATLTWLLVALGVLLRLLEYSDNRGIYMDEGALLRNLEGRSIFDLTTPLTENQLAPPGFLVVARTIVRLPGNHVQGARLIPLVCSIASMFLMRRAGIRFLSPRAVPIAVGLFALNDWVIYYATELKQYSSDIMLTLGALLLASAPEEMSRQRRLALAGFGVLGVWFSFPLALVLGSVGTYLAGRAAIGHNWKRMGGYVAMSFLWAISFVICFVVSHRILGKDRFIWDWWEFAFLPIPPRSVADLKRVFWHLLNVFNSPAWVLTPLGVLASAFLALGLYLKGALALGRRWRGGVYLLIGPVLVALLASALRQYPFHGRLLLFLVPTVHLLIGEGAATLRRSGGAILTVALAGLLLIQPANTALWNRLIQRRFHVMHDSHGDLLHDLLDYLDKPVIDNPSVPSMQ